MTPQTNLEKLQRLLRKLFEFDSAELDFGIYRIMKYKRDVIEKFIEKDLVESISAELDSGALAEQSEAVRKLQEVKERILRDFGKDALDGDGNLVEQYRTLPIGKKYLSLKANISGAKARPALEAMIFNHLYTFFSRYYDNGDFISKHQYSTKKERYAIPYNGEEVHLHWANNDQYYIKTSEYFTDYKFNSKGITVHFELQNAQVEQDNVKGDKRFFIPLVKEVSFNAKGKQIIIPFEYRPLIQQEEIAYGKRNQQETIITKALEVIPRRFKKNKHVLSVLLNERRKTAKGESVSYLEHHLRRYAHRNTSDFFIHKDLKGFLERELDFYIKNEVLNIDELGAAGEVRSESWFQIMRVIKAIGHRIIEFLAQIENFQRNLFEKKKFVTETNYCITVGHVPGEFYKEIVANESQWQEWKELFHIDKEQRELFTSRGKKERRMEFLKTHPTLVLDTCHFNAGFTDRLLGSFDDLDEQMDGLLIHSENFQALNLLQERYLGKIKSIYIDPLYNTGSDEFLFKDNYKHSSWLTMMRDRLKLAKEFLKFDGIFYSNIDDNEVDNLGLLLNVIFVNKTDKIIWKKASEGRWGKMKNVRTFRKDHEYLMVAYRNKEELNKIIEKPRFIHDYGNPDNDPRGPYKAGSTSRKEEASDPNDSNYYTVVSPTGKKFTRQWDVPKEEFDRLNDDGRIYWGKGRCSVPALKIFLNEERKITPYSILVGKGTNTEAKREFLNILGNQFGDIIDRINPKPEKLIYTLVQLATDEDSIVLDFFAGSGTTAHAVFDLNRQDGGRRKCILIEMGEYFGTVLLPRIKKVIFTPEWGDGKPKRQATQEEVDRSPRIVKYIQSESYEDALNNIRFDEKKGQQALQFDDYLLKYMFDWETAGSGTLLNVEKLSSPFSYKLFLTEGQERKEKLVDLPETFNYLLGLHVKTRRVYNDRGRRYLVYRGTVDHREVVVMWRDTKGWKKKDLERDKKFVAKQKLNGGADEIFVNGDSFIPEAKALEPVFKSRMFRGR